MKLHFLGTRGGIIDRSSLHYRHSSLLISFKRTAILLDWGADWLNIQPPDVDALFLTHAHADHSAGILQGFPSPVYASQETWDRLSAKNVDKKIVENRETITIGAITVQCFTVEHSIRAPAVGYRITAGQKALFYVSDLVRIHNEDEALNNIDCYIGDGAIIKRRLLIRKKDSQLTGHSPIIDQLAWCKNYNVPMVIFTHCGSEIVHSSEETLSVTLKELECEYDTKIIIAHDDLKLVI